MYEISVVEIAIFRTTQKTDALPLLSRSTAAIMKTVATAPDNRFARSGVPSRSLKTQKYGKNAPSAAATASVRSPLIIQAEPELIGVKMNSRAVTPNMKFAAPP